MLLEVQTGHGRSLVVQKSFVFSTTNLDSEYNHRNVFMEVAIKQAPGPLSLLRAQYESFRRTLKSGVVQKDQTL
jgi:hypothetical protein